MDCWAPHFPPFQELIWAIKYRRIQSHISLFVSIVTWIQCILIQDVRNIWVWVTILKNTYVALLPSPQNGIRILAQKPVFLADASIHLSCLFPWFLSRLSSKVAVIPDYFIVLFFPSIFFNIEKAKSYQMINNSWQLIPFRSKANLSIVGWVFLLLTFNFPNVIDNGPEEICHLQKMKTQSEWLCNSGLNLFELYYCYFCQHDC